MSEAGLEVREVTKRFGGVMAISSASLTVPMGRVHGLIGPNGAGKSTMIGVISGFIKGFSGAVRFRTAAVAFRPTARDRPNPKPSPDS